MVKDADLTVRLRSGYAITLIVALLVQLLIADGVFIWYAFANDWKIPVSAINVWLGAAVVQVVSLVLAITKYLFSAAATPQLHSSKRAKHRWWRWRSDGSA